MSIIRVHVGRQGSPPCLWPLERFGKEPVLLVNLDEGDILYFCKLLIFFGSHHHKGVENKNFTLRVFVLL